MRPGGGHQSHRTSRELRFTGNINFGSSGKQSPPIFFARSREEKEGEEQRNRAAGVKERQPKYIIHAKGAKKKTVRRGRGGLSGRGGQSGEFFFAASREIVFSRANCPGTRLPEGP
jgi:hypothetical protein